MEYKIYIADYKKKNVYRLPILPEDLPAKEKSADVEAFFTADGDAFTIIKQVGPETLQLEITAFEKRTSKKKVTGPKIEKIISDAMEKKEPIWLMVIKPNGKYYTNKTYAVGSYSGYIDKINKWHISVSLQRWKKY